MADIGNAGELDAFVEYYYIVIGEAEYLKEGGVFRYFLEGAADRIHVSVILILQQGEMQVDEAQALQLLLGRMKQRKKPLVVVLGLLGDGCRLLAGLDAYPVPPRPAVLRSLRLWHPWIPPLNLPFAPPAGRFPTAMPVSLFYRRLEGRSRAAEG